MRKRCEWAKSELMIEYHDNEWGVPVHDDRKLFEMLILEGVQAGLSWITILKKRGNYRKAFDNFDPIKISRYSDKDVIRLLDENQELVEINKDVRHKNIKIKINSFANGKKMEIIEE